MKKCTNPGIYCFLNTRDGKKYIGKSKNAVSRINGHRTALKRGAHENKHFQRAFSKDEEYFVEVMLKKIKRFHPNGRKRTIRDIEIDLNQWEEYFINFYASDNPHFGYNKTSGGDGGNGSKASLKTREKHSKNMKLAYAEGRRIPFCPTKSLGVSKEHAKRIGDAHRLLGLGVIQKIVKLRLENMSVKDIAKKFDVKASLIYDYLAKNLTEEQKKDVDTRKTLDHREKMSKINTDRHPSDSSSEKMSIAKKGKAPWNKGKKGVQINANKDKTYEEIHGEEKAKSVKASLWPEERRKIVAERREERNKKRKKQFLKLKEEGKTIEEISIILGLSIDLLRHLSSKINLGKV